MDEKHQKSCISGSLYDGFNHTPMLHTIIPHHSALTSGSLQAAPSFFLSLPQEVHFRLGALMDPKTLSNIVQTCCQCKEDYDTDVNFIPFLKPEYQKQVPKQLSKEMFSFEARKRYNITFQHSKRFLKGEPLKYLLVNNIVDKKDVPFFSEYEVLNLCSRFEAPNIRRLIRSHLLSIEETKNLTNNQVERLSRQNIYRIVNQNRLSLADIENLTNNQFQTLCGYRIYELFMAEKLSLDDIECLTSNQLGRLYRDDIYRLFEKNRLSLQTIENLTNDQLEKLRMHYILVWIERSTLSLEDLENFSLNKLREVNSTFDILSNKTFISRTTIYTLTRDQIYRLCRPNISKLISKRCITLEELDNLSNKQIDRLSNYKIYWLFKKKILRLQDIENLSDDQMVDLSKCNTLHLMTTKSTFYWNSFWANLKNQPRKKL